MYLFIIMSRGTKPVIKKNEVDTILNSQTKTNALLIVFIIALTNLANIIVFYTNMYVVLVNIIFIFTAVTFSIINNQLNGELFVNNKVWGIILAMILFFIINIFLVEGYTLLALSEFGKFVIYGLSALFISSFKFDIKAFKIYWYKFSILFFLVLHLILPSVVSRDFSYMQAGFIINFIMVGLVFKYFEKYNNRWLIAVFYLLLLSLLFGHRGSLLVNIFLIGFLLIKSKKVTQKHLLFWVPILLISFIVMFRFNLFTRIYDFLASQMTFFNSYSLRKILSDLENGTLDLSGRESFYSVSWDLIKNNFFVIPNGFGKFQHVSDLIFPHNIFLDMYLVFGVFSLIIIFYFVSTVKKIDLFSSSDFQLVYASIFIYSIIRLLTGGSFLTDVSFWVLIGMSINYHLYNNEQVNTMYELLR